MRRSLFRATLALALLLASATPAFAGKPEHFPGEIFPPIELAAGEVCDFPLTLDTTILRSRVSIWDDGAGTVRVVDRGFALGVAENADGDQVMHKGGYRLEFVGHPDGSLDVTFSGTIFAWYFAGDPIVGLDDPGAYALRGHGWESYAPDGSLEAARFVGGHVTDLCEALDPNG